MAEVFLDAAFVEYGTGGQPCAQAASWEQVQTFFLREITSNAFGKIGMFGLSVDVVV